MVDELSIIIPTLNEERYLPKLLHSIIMQKFPGKLQIVIVDGKSDDRTVEVANSFKKKIPDLIVVQTTRGVSHQRNVGAQKAKYKYIFFIDADIVLPRGYINRFLRNIRNDRQYIASSFMWPADGEILDYVALACAYPIALAIYAVKPYIGAGLTFTTKENHERIGGYNESLKLGEDIDYSQRTIKLGAKPKFFSLPYALHSPRRARKMGRVGLLMFWLRAYMHLQRHGEIKDNKKFDYPVGHFN